MAAKLVIAPEAEQDIAEAYSWYEGRRAGLGEEFLSLPGPGRTEGQNSRFRECSKGALQAIGVWVLRERTARITL
jgi:hypothetical protein